MCVMPRTALKDEVEYENQKQTQSLKKAGLRKGDC